MLDSLNGDELRRFAARCAESADTATMVRAERERLMRIHQALLALADNADWLSGRSRSLQAAE